MSVINSIHGARAQLSMAWLARTEQERSFLSAGAVIVALALVYGVGIAPALNGRAALAKSLPELHQQVATLQALAVEATDLANTTAPQITSMTRESLSASLAARSLTAGPVVMAGDYAKIDLKDVPFANLVAWLDAQRRENRIGVQEATISARPTAGQVDAQLTLHQNSGAPQ